MAYPVWEGLLAILTLVVVHKLSARLWNLHKASASIAHLPGRQYLWIDPFRSLALVVGMLFPPAGRIGHLNGKFSLYEKHGSTCLSSVKLWNAQVFYWFADAEALKSVADDRYTFQKDVVAYKPLNIYGDNIIGTEGADWKRHRAITNSAFNDANIVLLWAETIRIVNEWFSYLDGTHVPDLKNRDIPLDVVPSMKQASLLILSSAGFGRSASWVSDSSSTTPPGHQLTFRDTVVSVFDNLLVKALTPKWLISFTSYVKVPYLSRHLEDTERAFKEMRDYITELVSHMRAEIVDGTKSADSGFRGALLRNLTEANMSQEMANNGLTDDELLSNIFAFLIAGHETIAHTLGFAIALLALHQDAQHKIFEEVSRIWPSGCPTSGAKSSFKEDFNKLEYTTAFFRETLRCFPSAPRIAKQVHADAILNAQRFASHVNGLHKYNDVEAYKVAVPKGSIVIMDIYAANMNPLHWGEDAAEFKPERFIDTDAYRMLLTFSAGARGCVGSRFALAESVCILALLVRKYEVIIPSDMESLTQAEQERILLKWRSGTSIVPTGSRVRLRNRN